MLGDLYGDQGPWQQPRPYDPGYVQLMENQAQSIVYPALSRGFVPNPRVAGEAMRSLQGNLLGQLYQTAPNLVGRYVSVNVRPPVSDPLQSSFESYDPATYDTWARRKIARNENGADRWKALGEIPLANPYYVYDLATTNDTTRIKRWQKFLAARGFAVDEQARPLPVSGVWDQRWGNAVRSFYISLFAPEAIASPNEHRREILQNFLTSIANFDPTLLIHLDDKKKARWVLNYIDAIGQSSNPLEGLRTAVHDLGEEFLPKAFQIIAKQGHDGPLWALAHTIFGSDILADQDFVKALKSLDPSEQQLALSLAHSVSTSSIVARGLGTVADALSVPMRMVEQSILTARYLAESAGRALFGQGSASTLDPFEAWAKAGRNVDNFAAAMFGSWIQQHPWLAGIVNFGASVAFDPLTYIPVLGWGAKIVKEGEVGLKVATGAFGLSRETGKARVFLMHPAVMRDGFKATGKGRYLFDMALMPHKRAMEEMLRTVTDPNVHGWQAARMLGISDNDLLVEFTRAKEAHKLGDTTKLERLLEERQSFLMGPSSMASYLSALKAFRPNTWKRYSSSRALGLIEASGMVHRYRFGHAENLSETIEHLHQTAKIAGVPDKILNPLLDVVVTGPPTQRMEAIETIGNEIRRWLDVTHPNVDWDKIERGEGYGTRAAESERRAYLPVRDPSSPTGWREASTVARPDVERRSAAREAIASGRRPGDVRPAPKPGEKPPPEPPKLAVKISPKTGKVTRASRPPRDPVEYLQKQLQNGERFLQHYRDNLIAEYLAQHPELGNLGRDQLEAVVEASVEYRSAKAEIDRARGDISGLLEHLQAVRGDIPRAAYSTQFADWYMLPFSPYEILVHTHPGLAKAEWLQRKLHLDQFMDTWKKITLLNVATGLRIVFGEETVRAFISHFAVSPRSGFRYLGRLLRSLVDKRYEREMMERLPAPLKQQIINLFASHRQGFMAIMPEDPGYAQALHTWVTKIIGEDPAAQQWIRTFAKTKGEAAARHEAAKAKLAEWILKTKDPVAAEFRRRDGFDEIRAKTDEELAKKQKEWARHWAESYDLNLRIGLAFNPEDSRSYWLFDALHKHITTGKKHERLTRRELAKMAGQRMGTPQYLPLVVGEPAYHWGDSYVMRRFNAINHKWHNDILGQWINKSRARFYESWRQERIRELSRLHPEMSRERIEKYAANDAYEMVRRSVYQFQRSITGQIVRNIFPFWGATTNMQKFFLRTAYEHPVMGVTMATVLPQAKQWSDDHRFGIPISPTGRILAALHMGSGQDLMWRPQNAWFATADGLAGFVPGLGPLVSLPLKNVAQNDDNVRDFLETLPGPLAEQFRLTIESTGMFPKLEDFAQGITLMTGNDPINIPLFTRDAQTYQKMLAEKAREIAAERLARGEPVGDISETDVRREVGKDLLLTGALRLTVPGTPKAGTATQSHIINVRQLLDEAPDDATKRQILRDNPDVAPILAYQNPENLAALLDPKYAQLSGIDARDEISRDYPWVVAYQPVVTANVPTIKTSLLPGTKAYQAALRRGDIRYVSPPELVSRIDTAINIRDGWTRYNAARDLYTEALLQSGATPQSDVGRELKALIVDPVVNSLAQTNKAWSDAFSRITAGGTAGLDSRTRRLTTYLFEEILPHHDTAETDVSNAWRQVFVWIEQTAGQIRAMDVEGATNEQKQRVLDALNLALDDLATRVPDFGRQLRQFERRVPPSERAGEFAVEGLRRRFVTFDDLVHLEAA